MIMSLHIPHWGDSIDNLVTDVRPHCLCYSNALTAPARAKLYICRLNQPVGKGEAEEHWLQQPSGGPKVTGLTRWGANFSGIRFTCGCCRTTLFDHWLAQLRNTPDSDPTGGGDTERRESHLATWHAATD